MSSNMKQRRTTSFGILDADIHISSNSNSSTPRMRIRGCPGCGRNNVLIVTGGALLLTVAFLSNSYVYFLYSTSTRIDTRMTNDANEHHTNNEVNVDVNVDEVQVEGAVLLNDTKIKTDPSFHIWLFPPHTDIISHKIYNEGLYEMEEIEFTKLIVEESKLKLKSTLKFSNDSNDDGDDEDDDDDDNATSAPMGSKSKSKRRSLGWVVDIGANIGFHTLHMAKSGMDVIAFEPSPDTASLLKKSIKANGLMLGHGGGGSGSGSGSGSGDDENMNTNDLNTTTTTTVVHAIQAAAGECDGFGRLMRRSDSAGMTVLQPYPQQQKTVEGKELLFILPFQVEKVIGDDIPILRPERILDNIITSSTTNTSINTVQVAEDAPSSTSTTSPPYSLLRLLKVDAEGHELHAIRGINLQKYPFEYLTFEFFPEMLWKGGNTDPLDLLLFVSNHHYKCSTQFTAVVAKNDTTSTSTTDSRNNEDNKKDIATTINTMMLMETPEDFRAWYENHAEPAYKKNVGYHINLYCIHSL